MPHIPGPIPAHSQRRSGRRLTPSGTVPPPRRTRPRPGRDRADDLPNLAIAHVGGESGWHPPLWRWPAERPRRRVQISLPVRVPQRQQLPRRWLVHLDAGWSSPSAASLALTSASSASLGAGTAVSALRAACRPQPAPGPALPLHQPSALRTPAGRSARVPVTSPRRGPAARAAASRKCSPPPAQRGHEATPTVTGRRADPYATHSGRQPHPQPGSSRRARRAPPAQPLE